MAPLATRSGSAYGMSANNLKAGSNANRSKPPATSMFKAIYTAVYKPTAGSPVKNPAKGPGPRKVTTPAPKSPFNAIKEVVYSMKPKTSTNASPLKVKTTRLAPNVTNAGRFVKRGDTSTNKVPVVNYLKKPIANNMKTLPVVKKPVSKPSVTTKAPVRRLASKSSPGLLARSKPQSLAPSIKAGKTNTLPKPQQASHGVKPTTNAQKRMLIKSLKGMSKEEVKDKLISWTMELLKTNPQYGRTHGRYAVISDDPLIMQFNNNQNKLLPWLSEHRINHQVHITAKYSTLLEELMKCPECTKIVSKSEKK